MIFDNSMFFDQDNISEIESIIIDSYAKELMLDVRYLSSQDSYFDERELYLNKVFAKFAKRVFSEDETFALSRAQADYEILVIGGSDPIRLGRFLRTNRAILNTTAKVALINGSTPQRRARLLNSGFDEVIDPAKTPPLECKARIMAVMNRCAAAREAERSAKNSINAIAHICKPGDLTPREFDLIYALGRHEGRSLSITTLTRLVDPRDPITFKRSIKVNISNLRKKLHEPYRIEADYMNGYRLYRANPADVDD